MQGPTVPHRTRLGGFTLVELMIVVVVAAILMSIAVPSYQASIRKSRRTEARTGLLDLAGREESYMSTMNAYTTVAANVGYAAFPVQVGSLYYAIQTPVTTAATALVPATFTLTALPVAGNGQDKDTQCASFSVTSTGKQSALDSTGADATQLCWQQ